MYREVGRKYFPNVLSWISRTTSSGTRGSGSASACRCRHEYPLENHFLSMRAYSGVALGGTKSVPGHRLDPGFRLGALAEAAGSAGESMFGIRTEAGRVRVWQSPQAPDGIDIPGGHSDRRSPTGCKRSRPRVRSLTSREHRRRSRCRVVCRCYSRQGAAGANLFPQWEERAVAETQCPHFGVGVPVTAFHCEKPTSLAVTRKEGKGSRRTILPLSGCSGRVEVSRSPGVAGHGKFAPPNWDMTMRRCG